MSEFHGQNEMEIRLRFLDTEERIKPQELSNYIYWSKVLYSAVQNEEETAAMVINHHEEFEDDLRYFNYIIDNREQVVSGMTPYLSTISNRKRTSLFWEEDQDDPLEIDDIGKENPIEIVFVGLGSLVILIAGLTAGGAEVEVNSPIFSGKAGISCKKSLGEGIQDVKDAFEDDDGE